MADTPVVETPRASGRAWDWPAIAGIASAPLFFVGVGVSPESPDFDAPLDEWVDWATDVANGTRSLISIYLVVFAALAFLYHHAHVLDSRWRGVEARALELERADVDEAGFQRELHGVGAVQARQAIVL